MMPSRPWPRIVRGRTMVTSSPAATASWHSSSALQLGPAVGLERAARRVLGDGVVLGDPEHRARRRVHDLGDAARRAPRRSTLAVPPTFTDVEQRRGPWPAAPGRRCGTRRRCRRTRRAPRRGRGRRRRRTRRRPASVRAGSGRRCGPRRRCAERLLGEHGAEVAAAAGDQDRDRAIRAGRRARGTSGRSPACRRTARRRVVAELLARPARCRRRSCPSARRARAAPARSGPRACSERVELLRDHARRRAGCGGWRAGRHAEPFGLERVAHGREDVAQLVRLGVGDPVGAARRGLGRASAQQHALHEVARVHHRPALRARRRRAGTGRAGPRRGTASGGRAGTGRRTTAAAR